MIIFRVVVKQYRERRKLTQDQLAYMAGINQGYLAQIEKGLKTPSLGTLEKLGKALNVYPFRLVIFDISYKKCKRFKSKSKKIPRTRRVLYD